MFAWLGAGWLAWLPLAAAPIVFHLAYRRRRQRLAVPSLLLFHKLEPKLSARRRLRDWLVLACRCLVIAFAVLALARPSVVGFGGGGAAAIAIVVDNSASMAMPARGAPARSRLAAALEGAAALVGALDGGDRAAVVPAVADAAVPDVGLSGDRARLRGVLDQVRETEAAARPAAALARAARILDASGAARREIHLFTDAQESDWGAPGETPPLPAGTALVVHRIAAGEPAGDAALAEVRLSDRARLANRPVPLRVTVANPTAKDVTVTVGVLDDGGRRADKAASIPARGRVEVALAVPAAPAGERWAQISLAGDGFAGDDRAFVAFRTEAARVAAFVGERRDYGALPLAVAPDSEGALSGIAARIFPDTAAALAAKPAFLALTWDRAATADAAALRAFVEAGGRLLVLPRPLFSDAAVPMLPEWCGVRAATALRFAKGSVLVPMATDADAWRDLVAADGSVGLGRARAGAAFALDPGEGARALLGLADGRGVLLERPLGQGRVFVAGIAWTPAWSTLPLAPASLALAQAMALAPAGDDGVLRLVAGEPPATPPTGAVVARARAGAALDWHGDDEAPPLARAGVYTVDANGAQRTVAVRCAPGEGAPACVAGPALPAFGGAVHRIVDYTGPDAMVSEWRTARTGVDGAPWLIALALAALALETWLADRRVVRAPAKAAAPSPGGEASRAEPAAAPAAPAAGAEAAA